MSRPLLCLCPLEDVRRSGDSDNQEERQTRGQAATDLQIPWGPHFNPSPLGHSMLNLAIEMLGESKELSM